MQLLPDFYSMLRELSWATLALIVGGVVYAIYRLLVWWLSGLLESHGKAVGQINVMYESASEVMTEIRSLQQETKILIDSIQGLCNRSTCPMVAVLEDRHKQVDRVFADIREKLEDSLNKFEKQNRDIYNRINSFTDELLPELVREARARRKRLED